MTAEYKNWQEEFVDINFTDQRLKSRFFKIIDAFAASPGKSTWAATGSRSSAKAAYRFFRNSEISKDELLDSISRATVEKIKCADAEWILAVQDTTAVGFGDRKAIQGMGYDCSTEQRGMRVHSCIAVTDQGIPLGIIYQETNTREKLELTAIYVHESGKKGTEWFLLTTVTVKSEKEIEKLVQCYAHRWKIERFHFILKSGCKIEKNQAREYGRLSFLTLLYSVIAMQILNLTYLGKICPEISSGIVFVEEEWKVLCCCARKSKEIPEAYSLKEAIYDLGVLGGTKGAPSDGMPGVRSIWQGLDVLYSLLAYRNYLV